MNNQATYQVFADITLLLHVLVVAFVVIGLILIIVGNRFKWQWVNLLWFRLLHLTTILFVVAEAWLGLTCPLTTLEMWLRKKAGGHYYDGGFVQHWLQQLLYWDFPSWVFTIMYSLFAILVVGTWILYPPQRKNKRVK